VTRYTVIKVCWHCDRVCAYGDTECLECESILNNSHERKAIVFEPDESNLLRQTIDFHNSKSETGDNDG